MPPETKKPLVREAVGSCRGGAAFAPCASEEAPASARSLARRRGGARVCDGSVPILRHAHTGGTIGAVLDLFPESAAVEDGTLVVGGARTTDLADEHGTPLVIYCERTLRTAARAYRAAAPEAL